jgi:hypothetical protein
MARETKAAVYNTTMLSSICMLVNVFVKNSPKENVATNAKQAITISITTIRKDVKVRAMPIDWVTYVDIRFHSACDCHPYGIVDKQCDTTSGMCQCRANVVGQRCDRCQVRHIERTRRRRRLNEHENILGELLRIT